VRQGEECQSPAIGVSCEKAIPVHLKLDLSLLDEKVRLKADGLGRIKQKDERWRGFIAPSPHFSWPEFRAEQQEAQAELAIEGGSWRREVSRKSAAIRTTIAAPESPEMQVLRLPFAALRVAQDDNSYIFQLLI
jgi:hypothetical protein